MRWSRWEGIPINFCPIAPKLFSIMIEECSKVCCRRRPRSVEGPEAFLSSKRLFLFREKGKIIVFDFSSVIFKLWHLSSSGSEWLLHNRIELKLEIIFPSSFEGRKDLNPFAPPPDVTCFLAWRFYFRVILLCVPEPIFSFALFIYFLLQSAISFTEKISIHRGTRGGGPEGKYFPIIKRNDLH